MIPQNNQTTMIKPALKTLFAIVVFGIAACNKSASADPTLENEDVRVQIVGVRPESQDERTLADFSTGGSGSKYTLKAPPGQKLYQVKILVTPKRRNELKEENPMLRALAESMIPKWKDNEFLFSNPFLYIKAAGDEKWTPSLTILQALSKVAADEPKRQWMKMAIPGAYESVRIVIPVGATSTFVLVHGVPEAASDALIRLDEQHQATIKLGTWGDWK